MSDSTSTPTQLLQDFVGDFYSRRMLVPNPIYQPPAAASPPVSRELPDANTGDNGFDANVVMVLSVLLCALICSLGLNSIIRCAFRCTRLVSSSDSSGNNSDRTANTGVKKKALKTFPTVSYSTELNLPGLDTECVICLSEFTPGERVRILPKCNHGFHVRCIDKWLSSHSSCPKCRHCLIETCQKILGTSEPPVQESSVRIGPLEPEGLVRNYRALA